MSLRDHVGADTRPVVVRVVNNRVFLLGLDALYREAIKPHERGELRVCAQKVAAAVGVNMFRGPVEGYYAEDGALTAYFRWIRALQAVPGSERVRVAQLREFQRLWEVASSPLYGRAVDTGRLLPAGRDPLSEAMQETQPEWTLPRLLEAAHRASLADDDCSLVGLGALARDPVVLAALRESMVLHAELVFLEAPEPPRYEFVWQVEDEIARKATRFVQAFNRLFPEHLPEPIPQNAETFWHACDEQAIVGRCVAIGATPPPSRYYHWAICRDAEAHLAVHEFWAQERWTTQRYRGGLASDGKPAP